MEESQKICNNCIEEPYLSTIIREANLRAVCSFCRTGGFVINYDTVKEMVRFAINIFYTPTTTTVHDPERGSVIRRFGTPLSNLVRDLCRCKDEVAIALATSLSLECPLDKSATISTNHRYELRKRHDISVLTNLWVKFKKNIKYKSRHFNRESWETLMDIFSIIEKFQPKVRQAVIEIGPGTGIPSLFRSRVFQNDEELKKALRYPDKELGPPPPAKTSPGRMNSEGIPVFYGSNDIDTTIYECRPPLESTIVSAEFKINKKLRILDFCNVCTLELPEKSFF